ncbi:MAG TPA: acyl-CoA dehydrogenase family protein [Microbacteriaceae bacterium]|nr:acyl-CoA dehydrogenase family protein [Microbacteriaceae bacterium]
MSGFQPVGVTEPEYDVWQPVDPDLAGLYAELSDDDRAYWQRARAFVQDEVRPVIEGYWDRAEYPLDLARRMGALDLLRDGIDVDGFAPQTALAAGLVVSEISRGDGSLGTVIGVQGGLALRTIAWLGSEQQRGEWLGSLARAERLGGFGLTEPTHGSDSVSLETTAKKVDGGYVLNGEKKWIGNGSVGDVTVIWARGDNGQVQGFLVPQSADGYHATTITGKMSLRAIWQAHIVVNDVFVPDDARLPGANSFADTARVLAATRLGVAWGALGQATAVYETAVNYAKQRVQFGRPIAATQSVQERLSAMLSELTSLQTLLFRLTAIDARGELPPSTASLAKLTATRSARSLAATARDMLGGNGILLRHRVGRHFADIEAMHTYEGTETIQGFIVGRDITGFSAFA